MSTDSYFSELLWDTIEEDHNYPTKEDIRRISNIHIKFGPPASSKPVYLYLEPLESKDQPTYRDGQFTIIKILIKLPDFQTRWVWYIILNNGSVIRYYDGNLVNYQIQPNDAGDPISYIINQEIPHDTIVDLQSDTDIQELSTYISSEAYQDILNTINGLKRLYPTYNTLL